VLRHFKTFKLKRGLIFKGKENRVTDLISEFLIRERHITCNTSEIISDSSQIDHSGSGKITHEMNGEEMKLPLSFGGFGRRARRSLALLLLLGCGIRCAHHVIDGQTKLKKTSQGLKNRTEIAFDRYPHLPCELSFSHFRPLRNPPQSSTR